MLGVYIAGRVVAKHAKLIPAKGDRGAKVLVSHEIAVPGGLVFHNPFFDQATPGIVLEGETVAECPGWRIDQEVSLMVLAWRAFNGRIETITALELEAFPALGAERACPFNWIPLGRAWMEDHIIIGPAICNGRPVFRGARITVQTVLEFLGAGDSIQEVLLGFPKLTREDILAGLRYSSRLMGNHFVVEKVV